MLQLFVRNCYSSIRFSCILHCLATSNEQGECIFPYQLESFQMYFCEKTDPNLPATCPIQNENISRINCSEGIQKELLIRYNYVELFYLSRRIWI